MSGKDKLISVEHLKWNVGGIKCGTLSVDYLNWILDHEEPAVDAVPVRRGKWIWKGEDGDSRWMCSECKCKEYVPTCNDVPNIWDYCPNCGCRMNKE